jgi:hypothetical protein
MRKLSALLLVAGMFTFVACQKKQETTATDSTATTVTTDVKDTTTVVPASGDSAKVDSMPMKKEK